MLKRGIFLGLMAALPIGALSFDALPFDAWADNVGYQTLLDRSDFPRADFHRSEAHTDSTTAQHVLVVVRFLRATTARPVTSDQAPPSLGAGLQDIAQKLGQLPFKNFEVLDTERKVVTVAHRDSIPLHGGYELNVRPLYIESDKIGMWLRWTDGHGMRLVDTRIHITPNDTVITGADGGGDVGDVLAIKVSPAP